MLRRIRVILSIALTVGMALFIYRHWKLFQRIPKNYEWNTVETFLKTHAANEDLLLFEPSWLVGYAQVHSRMTHYSVATQGEIFKGGYPPTSRLWLISVFKDSHLRDRLRKAGFFEEKSSSFYSLALTPYQASSKNIAYDFVQNLSKAKAFLDYGDNSIKVAEWKNGAWVFSGFPDWWHHVSIRQEGFRRQGARRCLWLHPLEEAVKNLSYDGVLMGKRMELFGGIVDSGVRTPPGGPVYLFVHIDGKKVASLEFRDTDTQFHRVIDTSSFSKSTHQVGFQVTTPSQSYRHFCFSAWSVKE